MQITKSRLKQIIKEELLRVNESYEEIEHQQVSDLERAVDLTIQLEEHILPDDPIGKKILGELVGILANVADSESQELEDEY